jgi:NitT/TauT family transport system substrate-binding protein
MAIHKGFFKEVGLDVEESVVDQGGTVMIRGIVADQFDLASMGPDPVITTAEASGGAKVIGADLPGLFYGIYSKKKYNSLADLKGIEIGTSPPGSLLEVLLRATALELKLDPKDYPAVNVGGSPAVFQAVVAGKIEAGVSSYDFLKVAEASPDVKLLVPFSDVLPKYVTIAVVASDKIIKEKPDVVQDFLNAYTRGVRYALDNKNEAVALAAEKLAKKPEEVAWEFDYFLEKKIVNPNMDVPVESTNYLVDLAVTIGQIKAKVPVDKVWDGTFVKKMLEVMGPYKSA